jgi:YggT family protein
MGNVTSNVAEFLIHTIFMLYLLAVVLRFLLASVRADFYNPMSQFLVSVTNPIIVPLRRIIPSVGQIDTASIVLMLAVKLLELWLLTLVRSVPFSLLTMLIIAIFQILELIIYIFIFSIIIQAIMSWISPEAHYYRNPVASVLYSLNEPLLRPVRRVLPQLGMIDLSPLVVIIGLNVMLIVLKSLYQY